MKNFFLKTFFFAVLAIGLSSCSSLNKSVREPNVRVELNKNDFALSGQVSGEATVTTYFGIDFEHLFVKNIGSVEGAAPAISAAMVPVIGDLLCDKTSGYALHEMISKNAGYDVVFYPTYEKKVVKPIGFGIYKITTVKVTGRLGKLK